MSPFKRGFHNGVPSKFQHKCLQSIITEIDLIPTPVTVSSKSIPAYCDGRASLPALTSAALDAMFSKISLAIFADQTASEAVNFVEPIAPGGSLDDIADHMIIPKIALKDMSYASEAELIEVLLIAHVDTKAADQTSDVGPNCAIHDCKYSHADRIIRVLEGDCFSECAHVITRDLIAPWELKIARAINENSEELEL